MKRLSKLERAALSLLLGAAGGGWYGVAGVEDERRGPALVVEVSL